MPVAFNINQELGQGDLDIFLTDVNDVPKNAYEITYAIYFVDESPPETEVLIGSESRTPVNPTVGEYYAALLVPGTATIGTYRIRWNIRMYVNSEPREVVQEWAVVGDSIPTMVSVYSCHELDMIRSLRILLRDNNPDRNYHFRPPEHEGTIKKYNRVFGYIWEDEELIEYLQRSLDWWNMMPPETEYLHSLDLIATQKPVWKTSLYWGAIVHAATALAFNWVADEFDYSIGGISLSIERSSKYESLKSNAEGQLDKATEIKARTTKYIRGLTQPRFGLGVRSAFGPHVGAGVLSPRAFVGI